MVSNQFSPAGKTTTATLECPLLPRKNILVVDDEPSMRRLNNQILARSGYQVDVAEDGASAWDMLQIKQYDLLITDQDMPKVSGLQLLQKLYAACKHLPAILATGKLPLEELHRHPWLPIEAILIKPYTFDQLVTTVKNVLLHATPGGNPHERALPATLATLSLRK